MYGARKIERNKSSRNLYAFGFTSLFNDTASEMAYWVLPAFLSSIGAGPAQLGIIEGIAESVASFVQLFSGYIADRIPRRKPVVVGGYLAANFVKPLLALATSWPEVLAVRFVDRFSKGMRGAPRDVMVAESVDKTRLGNAYGLIQALDSAGAILGPLLALLLVAHFGLRGIFWMAAIPGALCVLVAIFGIKETNVGVGIPTRARTETTLAKPAPALAVRFPAAFYYVLAVVTLFSLGNSSDMFLVLRAQSIGIPATHAPLLGLVFNIMYTVFAWPAGRISDRFSRRAIAAAGYAVFAVVYFVFAAAPSLLAVWCAMAFYGLFYALTNAVLKALVVESVAADVRGRALGIYFFVTSVAILVASIITGQLWKHYGGGVPFYLSSGLALLSAGLLLIGGGARNKTPA
ncbi:MAG TPA: MFS transporter [Terriglobales bacterium]|nr:MFS transporter [Terriglobales bacterium]